MRAAVAVIVEGHGDNAAVRLLLQRIWHEVVGGEYLEVPQPIRRPRGSLLKSDRVDLDKAIKFAVAKLAEVENVDHRFILLLIDAEDDCEKTGPLGPLLLERCQRVRADQDICCVIANRMYETWFVAAARSLLDLFDGTPHEPLPADPEAGGYGKAWIREQMGGRYRETVDQTRLTHRIDLTVCRRRSRSFDKLCRELARRVHRE